MMQSFSGKSPTGFVYEGMKKRHNVLSNRSIEIFKTVPSQNRDKRVRGDEYFRSIMECAQDGIVVLDENAFIQYATPSCEKIIGYTIEEIISINPFDIVHADDIHRARDNFILVIQSPGRLFSFEVRVRHKNGSWIYVEGIVRNLLHLPSVAGIVINCRDVTSRVLAERALRESEQKHRSLANDVLDNISAGIFIIDADYRIAWVNQMAEQYFCLLREDVIGKDMRKLIGERMKHIFDAPDQFSQKVLASYHNNTYLENFECHVLPEGNLKERWLEHWSQPITTGLYKSGRIEHYYDITQRKIAERKLLEQRAELKSLASELSLVEERERRRIAVDLHDHIGQSLVFSKIKLQQLKEKAPDEEFKSSLDSVCGMISDTICQTRTLTFDLSSPILYELGFEEAVMEWLKEQIEKKHKIRAEFIDDGQPKPLDDDVRVLLFRDVRELLVNVIKHAKTQSVRVSIRRVGDEIKVSVQDRGVGFVVSDAMMSTRVGAFGLFSVRERLEQCGGRIEIKSKPGKGTKVTMWAPLNCDSRNRISK